MKKIHAIAFLPLLSFVTSVNASLVELSWTSTISYSESIPGGDIGETITTVITVDNGNSSLLSQTWTTDDFISYRIEGDSWWISSDSIEDDTSSFATDGSGNVTVAGNWSSGFFDSSGSGSVWINTSWTTPEGDGFIGGWYSNGFNGIAGSWEAADYWIGLEVNNVSSNQIGSNWTASEISAVPVPAAAWLFGSGLLGLMGVARRKNAA